MLIAESLKKWALWVGLFSLLIVLIGHTIWFYINFLEIANMDSVCKQGWSALDYYNFIIAVIYTAGGAAITTIILLLFICFPPCLNADRGHILDCCLYRLLQAIVSLTWFSTVAMR